MIIAYLALYIAAIAHMEPPNVLKPYTDTYECHKEAAALNKEYAKDLKQSGGEFVCLVIKRESV